MSDILFTQTDLDAVKQALLVGDTERCVVAFAQVAAAPSGSTRLLVREFTVPNDSGYTKRSTTQAELSPEFVAVVTKRARREQLGLVFIHSHPGEDAPTFSRVDDFGEHRLGSFLAGRHPTFHAAAVVSQGGWNARRLGTKNALRVISIGTEYQIHFDPTDASQSNEEHDRQIRAFGLDGQRQIQELRVAVVGLGGTGSLIVQQLAHLGVQRYILVDPDHIDVSNLNRVVGATRTDVGRQKTEIASRYIRSLANAAEIKEINGDVTRTRHAIHLTDSDIIFGCTDSHGSRAVLQQIAYQYYIPCIDMGVVIDIRDRPNPRIFGRVQVLSPGLACLTCTELLNSEQVRRDMLNDAERQADQYIIGHHEPAPAVISLNGTAASLAITLLLSMVAGVRISGRHILYNASESTLRKIDTTPNENCFICSKRGSLGRGPSWPLMARQEE